jgi:hypothetical protein
VRIRKHCVTLREDSNHGSLWHPGHAVIGPRMHKEARIAEQLRSCTRHRGLGDAPPAAVMENLLPSACCCNAVFTFR